MPGTALGTVGGIRGVQVTILSRRVMFKLFNNCTEQLERSWLKQGPWRPHTVCVCGGGGINHLVVEL